MLTQQLKNVTETSPENKMPADASFKVYPAPGNDIIKLEFPPGFGEYSSLIEILGSDGKVAETRRLKGSSFTQINVSGLKPGFYVIRVTNNAQAITRTITITR